MSIKPDKETQEILTEGQSIANLLASDGWVILKAKFDARILDIQNINNVDVASAEATAIDLKARKLAADMMFDFLRKDVYGFVQQHRANSELFSAQKENSYIELH